MGEQQRTRCTRNAIFRIQTKQYQMERWLKAEKRKSNGLASLKVWSAIKKRHALTSGGKAALI